MASKRIVVMSDSHGDWEIVEAVKQTYLGKVDAIFHNGDSELPADDAIWDGISVVCGNCDYYGGYPDTLLTDLDGIRIAQTHGHLFSINFGWQKLDYWAQEVEADICLYGHLHVPDAEVRGGTLFLNPGSVSQPRGLVRECLYVLVTITDHHFLVEYFTRDHQLYPALTKELAR